jgi:hypothetical protein
MIQADRHLPRAWEIGEMLFEYRAEKYTNVV